MGWSLVQNFTDAASAITGSPVVMTASHEGRRAGMLASGLAIAAREPMCIVVTVTSGHRLAAMIRDSRCFGISLLTPGQRLLLKKIRAGAEGDLDPFDTIETRTLMSTCPLLTRAQAVFDCEVVRHLDMESDHELYVGKVLAAGMCEPAHAELDAHGVVAHENGSANGRSDDPGHSLIERLRSEAKGVLSAGLRAGGLGRALPDRRGE